MSSPCLKGKMIKRANMGKILSEDRTGLMLNIMSQFHVLEEVLPKFHVLEEVLLTVALR